MPVLVSVVITTCNRPVDILERAVNSVINQTYKNIELFVINDAPDNRGCLIDYFERREKADIPITFLSNEKQSGACVSRNNGLALAHGKYIAFLDDDDEWYPQKIEKQTAGMSEGAALVYSNFVVKSDTAVIKPDKHKVYYNGHAVEKLLRGNFIGGCSIPLLDTEVMRQCGGFDPAFRSSQDYDMWIRMAENHEIRYVDEILSVYYVGNTSITGNFDNRLKGWNRLLEKYHDLYQANPSEHMAFVSVMINEAAKLGHGKKAMELLVKSFPYFPHNLRCFYTLGKGILERILHKY